MMGYNQGYGNTSMDSNGTMNLKRNELVKAEFQTQGALQRAEEMANAAESFAVRAQAAVALLIVGPPIGGNTPSIDAPPPGAPFFVALGHAQGRLDRALVSLADSLRALEGIVGA